MKPVTLNTIHRYVGIVIAPPLVIQTLSGLILGFGPFRRAGPPPGDGGMPVAGGRWDAILMKIHFGPGVVGDTFHILLGAGVLWMAVSGWLLYLRLRRARKRLAATNAKQ